MSGIPYIERRRQKLYLRVRVPADITLLSGKKVFVKSLQTGDPRRARGEAARLLAGLHAGWQEVRRDVIRIAGKRLDELTGDDIPTLRASDLDELTPEEKDAVLVRLDALIATEELAVARREAEAARVQAEADQHRAVTAEIKRQRERRETLALGRALALSLSRQQPANPMPPAPPLPAEARQPWPDLVERFFTDRPSIGPSARTSHQQAFRELEALIGRKALVEVTKTEIKAFADHLRDRPINRAGKERMARTSIVKMLSHLKGFFGWAAGSGFITINPADGVQPRTETREERDGKDKRREFTVAELTMLFSSPLFTGCKSRSRRSEVGPHVYQDERYWFWLLALLTGARPEEIAALPSGLIELEGGIACLNFLHATKTSAGARLVPVLPELRRLGLEQWAEEQYRRGRKMVEGPNGSKDWSKWTNRYLDDIGIDDPTVVAYSLRHNFRQQLRAAGLHPEIVDKVFGHEGESVGAGYGRGLSPDEARQVVERVKSPIPLEHLYPLLPAGLRRRMP
ncbi:DUF6538 domain-containing protein [Azospirillum sp. TSO22-1]|uniref:DUF6538 domain-containing protein n=1 Tax=Azospirillum sp. TSO22-1 TaxID=716789 RepID=UPI000D609779|nr:DUF6538 domain-containing protein [Azospirillum sp. TSO22-1]PWC45875.1 hypothetical protein TSO221_15080 [Azospirillum sp. TSO22-1]